MEWSVSKLIRIETGDVRISANDLRVLLNFYGSSNEQLESMLVMARAAREPARWNIYRDAASPEYISFCGFESFASVVRNFEPMLVPGLLQTEEYAESVIKVVEDPRRIETLVDLRMQRQEILTKNPAPEFHFIIDESVIRRTVGSPGVMRRQLQHLMEVIERDNVTFRIVPLRAGMYARMRIAYVLFEFPSPEDEDILFIETPFNDMVIRENSSQERGTMTPVHYLGYFWELEQIARTEDVRDFLEGALHTFSSAPPGPREN
jgi:hypothetical protein